MDFRVCDLELKKKNTNLGFFFAYEKEKRKNPVLEFTERGVSGEVARTFVLRGKDINGPCWIGSESV